MQAKGPRTPGLSGLPELNDVQGWGLLLGGWFSQHLLRAPAFQQSLPCSPLHYPAFKGLPKFRSVLELGWTWGACGGALHPWGKQGMERKWGLRGRHAPLAQGPPLQAQTTCVQSHMPDPSRGVGLASGNLASMKHLALPQIWTHGHEHHPEVTAQCPTTRFSGHIQRRQMSN